ncbi:MAG: hypothetical protein WCG25_08525 [bacterium]
MSITVNILSFGITIKVSTFSLNFFNHSSALKSLFLPSNENGFVMIATVSIHILFAILATTGHAHVPVHHQSHNVMNTISVSCNIALISDSDSSAAFLHISGFAHAHNHFVRFNHILTFSLAAHVAKSCASVFIHTKDTHSNHSETILFIALQPHHHIHKTLIFAPGINSGIISFITILIV